MTCYKKRRIWQKCNKNNVLAKSILLQYCCTFRQQKLLKYYVSRHHWRTIIERLPETSQTSQHYVIEGLKGSPQSDPQYLEKCEPLGQLMNIFPVWILRIWNKISVYIFFMYRNKWITVRVKLQSKSCLVEQESKSSSCPRT